MQKTKKILVPIDFSSCSENALTYAIQLAAKIKATVRLLNITTVDVEDTENSYLVAVTVEEKIKAARQALNKSLTKVKKNISQSLEKLPEIETIIEIGSASLMISEIAKRDQLDFIIMGTQGENSVADRLLGSTASTAVKTAPCPLIVIPEGASFQVPTIMGYASILFNADPFEIWRATKYIRLIQPIATTCFKRGKQLIRINRFKGEL
jgi:nucleotide-binding universal stress UspA family protein